MWLCRCHFTHATNSVCMYAPMGRPWCCSHILTVNQPTTYAASICATVKPQLTVASQPGLMLHVPAVYASTSPANVQCVLWLTAVFLDVGQNGKLLDAAGCVSRYPQLDALLQSQDLQWQQAAVHNSSSSSQVGWHAPEAPTAAAPVLLQAPSTAVVWASLARSMVTAHQRRGESDLVAHWLYQLLALDTRAPEWAHVLQ